MEKFMNDLFSIYELINKNSESKSFINIKVISKQYLAYYIYRIITKYIKLIELGASHSEILEFMKYLRIPEGHKHNLNYPLAGKMTNDEEILDMIILRGLDMLSKTDKYIKTLPNQEAYIDLFEFLKTKEISIIVQDLIDLQTLIPGLSVPEVRPNYLDDAKL